MSVIRNIFKDSLLKNAIYLMITQISNLATGFFFWVIAAKLYSPSEVGIISALISSMMLLAMINNLGFSTSLLVYLPSNREKAGRIINSCITASSLASFIFTLIFILGLSLWAVSLKPVLIELKYILFFILITTASSISGLLSSSFVAGKKASFQTLKDFSFGLIKIVPLPFLVTFGAMGLFLSWGIGTLISVIIGIFLLNIVWENYRPSIALDTIIKKMASFSVGNYFAGIFNSLPRLVLPIMIVNSISAESAGFFYIAMTVAGLLYGVPQAVSSSLIAETAESGDLWGNVRKSVKFSAILLIPGILLFIAFGRYVLHLFNPAYGENAYTTLIILSIASIPLSVCTIYTAVRNSERRVSGIVIINAITAISILVLALPLMNYSGIEGAAIAFLTGNMVAAVLVILAMRNFKKIKMLLFNNISLEP